MGGRGASSGVSDSGKPYGIVDRVKRLWLNKNKKR